VIDDRFRVLAGLIQQLEIRRIGHIRWHTGGIDKELSLWRSRFVVPFHIVSLSVGRGIGFGLGVDEESGNGLVDRA
jgi:hypothetical protein